MNGEDGTTDFRPLTNLICLLCSPFWDWRYRRTHIRWWWSTPWWNPSDLKWCRRPSGCHWRRRRKPIKEILVLCLVWIQVSKMSVWVGSRRCCPGRSDETICRWRSECQWNNPPQINDWNSLLFSYYFCWSIHILVVVSASPWISFTKKQSRLGEDVNDFLRIERKYEILQGMTRDIWLAFLFLGWLV